MKLKIILILLFIKTSFLIAQTSKQTYLTVNDLRSKTLKELRYIRNEVFAQHGYVFKNPELKVYFSKKYKSIPKNSTNSIILTSEEKEYVALVKQIEQEKKVSSNNTILLEILTLLPGESRGSWDWSKEDRVAYVNKSILDGYLTNDNSGTFQKRFISDSYFFVGVIDGSWSLKLFKAKDNSYLVLAVDHVGDGNLFTTYHYKDDKLTKNKKEFYDLLSRQLFTNFYSNKSNCSDSYEDNFKALLEYTFNENTIELYDYYAKINKGCFNYDTTILEFNKDTKTFDLKETYWKNN